MERQVSGWTKRWDLVDAGRVPQMSVVAKRLAETLPAAGSRPPAVLHNDYKIDNCQFDPADPDRPRVEHLLGERAGRIEFVPVDHADGLKGTARGDWAARRAAVDA